MWSKFWKKKIKQFDNKVVEVDEKLEEEKDSFMEKHNFTEKVVHKEPILFLMKRKSRK